MKSENPYLGNSWVKELYVIRPWSNDVCVVPGDDKVQGVAMGGRG